jgi:ribosomal protein S27AE
MICPRCNSLLREHEPSLDWLRYFECGDCLSVWHIEVVGGAAIWL